MPFPLGRRVQNVEARARRRLITVNSWLLRRLRQVNLVELVRLK
jgi:hypothetical protein